MALRPSHYMRTQNRRVSPRAGVQWLNLELSNYCGIASLLETDAPMWPILTRPTMRNFHQGLSVLEYPATPPTSSLEHRGCFCRILIMRRVNRELDSLLSQHVCRMTQVPSRFVRNSTSLSKSSKTLTTVKDLCTRTSPL